MKKLFLILTVTLLVGCANLQGPANFDNNEYGLINKIYTLSEVYKLGCADKEQTKRNFTSLAELSMELVNYSADIPFNTDTLNMVIPLNKMVSDANISFATKDHTIAFCKLKLDNIGTSSGIIKGVVAKRRRV
jgi:hypothetical protein